MSITTFPIETVYQDQTAINVINVTDPTYGATGNGTTDDTVAIQAAIDAAAATGGPKVVYFPAPVSGGFYKCNGQLDFSATDGVTVLGDGSRVEPTQDRIATALVYTGTASVFIKAGKSRGLTFRGVAIQTNNASFTGDLMSLDSSGSPRVTYSTAIINCMFGGRSATACNARSGVNMTGAVEFFADKCVFGWLDYGIISLPDGSTLSYANAIHIDRCRFTEYGEWGMSIYSVLQASITRNVFEFKLGTGNTTPEMAGITGECIGAAGNFTVSSVRIAGNGFWDCSIGTAIELTPLGVVIDSNYFGLGSGGTGIHFHGGNAASVSGNRVTGSSGAKFIDVSIAPLGVLADDGANVVDSGVTYNNNVASTGYVSPVFEDIDSKTLMVNGGVASSDGKIQARRTVGSNAVGGTVIVDRNDSTNWRGAALYSYYDPTLATDGLAIGVSGDTTPPDDITKKKVFIDQNGAIQNGGGARFVGYTSSTSTPTTTELPNSKDWCFHNDTTGPTIYLAFNIGGVIKKLTLT